MSAISFPFAIRLIGFSAEDTKLFEAAFSRERDKGYGYFNLAEDNLQDPDLFIADADEARALATLADLKPSEVRPALLVGSQGAELPYPRIARPIQWNQFLEALDCLIEKRADALSRLEASDIVTVPERRRRDRSGPVAADSAEYERMRARLPDSGAVLVVDKSPILRDYLAELLARKNVSVDWTDNEVKAVESCRRQSVAVVMINTSAPGIDPYRLCADIKRSDLPFKISVIFLVGKSIAYDVTLARAAGADGYLTKPLAGHHLLSVLKKFLPFVR
jgi:CheY-like chemotaxis protein